MNAKIMSYKERLQRMLALINSQENIEVCYDFDENHVKEKEAEMIEEFCAELVGLNQLTFGQLAKHLSNATVLGTIVVNEAGACEVIN